MDKHKAYKAFHNHDKSSVFLGYSKSESDRWVAEIKKGETEKEFYPTKRQRRRALPLRFL
jgi:hypothetical protein